MSFSSIEFLFVFLPCFFLLYYLLPGQGKMLWLLVGSLVFYGWGCRETPWHLGLMAALTVVRFFPVGHAGPICRIGSALFGSGIG